MKQFKFVAIICSFALLGLAITPQVKADENNKKTIMTFSESVEIPGVGAQTLPAGTYVFTLLDVVGDRDVVQISNKAGTHVYATVLAIPNYRLKPTGKTVLTFAERGEGQPEAIKAWFYPGDNFGQQFVYPRKRAIELAKIVNEPVLALPAETEAVTIDTYKSVPVAAVQPTGEEVSVATVVETPPAAVAAAPPATEVAQALPQTASSLPLFALIGLLSLFAGFTLLIITKRSA